MLFINSMINLDNSFGFFSERMLNIFAQGYPCPIDHIFNCIVLSVLFHPCRPKQQVLVFNVCSKCLNLSKYF